jgi:hypothetical protein
LYGPDQFAALLVDWADATEVLVVFGDFKHPFSRDILASQDIFQKWNHVIWTFGAPEGNEQNRIDRHIGKRG